MKLLQPTTWDDMIATYLRAEIMSARFSSEIVKQLQILDLSRAILETPNIADPNENTQRRQILKGYRAYVFDELPSHVSWHRAQLTREEVYRVRYIDYSYWNELSNHTRLPSVAAEAIKAGREVFGVSNAGFFRAAQALREGAQFPELIVVGTAEDAVLTVFEGHVRLTTYMLAPECLPELLDVIVGFVPECAHI